MAYKKTSRIIAIKRTCSNKRTPHFSQGEGRRSWSLAEGRVGQNIEFKRWGALRFGQFQLKIEGKWISQTHGALNGDNTVQQFDMATHLLQNMPSGHIKVRKGSGHVFYMSTPCHTIESVPNWSPWKDYETVAIIIYYCQHIS